MKNSKSTKDILIEALIKKEKWADLNEGFKEALIEGVMSWVTSCAEHGLQRAAVMKRDILACAEKEDVKEIQMEMGKDLIWSGIESLLSLTVRGKRDAVGHFIEVNDFDSEYMMKRLSIWLGYKIGDNLKTFEPMEGKKLESLLRSLDEKIDNWDRLEKESFYMGMSEGLDCSREKSSKVDDLNKKLNEMQRDKRPKWMGGENLSVILDQGATSITGIVSGDQKILVDISLQSGWGAVEKYLERLRLMEDKLPEMNLVLRSLKDDLESLGVNLRLFKEVSSMEFKVTLKGKIDDYAVDLVLRGEDGEVEMGIGYSGDDFSAETLKRRILNIFLSKEDERPKETWRESLLLGGSCAEVQAPKRKRKI